MGLYISQEAVLVRLRNKVKVTADPDDQSDRLPLLLLNQLISEAEGQVEMDLSTRYMAPFQTVDCKPFAQLPERPTRAIIKTLCELNAVMRVLETDFGRGSAVDASKYQDVCMKRYNFILYGDDEKNIPGLITLRENSYNTFRLPPLPFLRSNYQVAAVDNGFAGYVDRSDDFGFGSYPAMQINSPEENFWSGSIDAEPQDFTHNE